MYDWIIEADIYRLNKAVSEASTAEEPLQLERWEDAKAQGIAANAGNPVAASQRAVERSLELLNMPFWKVRD